LKIGPKNGLRNFRPKTLLSKNFKPQSVQTTDERLIASWYLMQVFALLAFSYTLQNDFNGKVTVFDVYK